MKKLAAVFFFLLSAFPVSAGDGSSIPVKPVAFDFELLGDSEMGVVTRIVARYAIPQETPPEIPLVVQGSILQGGRVVRNFRYPVSQKQPPSLRFVQVLPPGEIELEARLLVPLEESTPVLLAKGSRTITVVKTNRAYIASEEDGAEGVVAEGVASETAGAVKIIAPRRDVAPNLFIVDVEVSPIVKRVEFFVEGKKIFTKNAPPYKAELDLGNLPKRVEVRVVGFDVAGRYVDADAWVVNERDNPLEVKITRTETGDGLTHFKVSLQNPQNRAIRSAALFAGQKKIAEFSRPPYSLTLTRAQLAGIQFVRASVVDETNYEASDLLFLDGQRFSEELEVNLIELPVSVTDAGGAAIADLRERDFQVFEEGKPKKISTFAYSTNLPLTLGVLVDRSGSMKSRMSEARDAAASFFKQIIGPNDRAFAVGFSFDSTNLPPFTSSQGALEAQVRAIGDAEGSTALYDAIVTGLYRFRSVPGRKALVIVTDGADTASRVTHEEMLNYVRAARVPLYFIGVGMSFLDSVGISKMKTIAAETGGVSYLIKDAKDLQETYNRLDRELRTQYLLSYYTESTKKDSKYRRVEVKSSRTGARVRTIRGFIP